MKGKLIVYVAPYCAKIYKKKQNKTKQSKTNNFPNFSQSHFITICSDITE